ncbi:unnamed protein product [Chilo suppressalis]|uniref:DUF4806 domain-containing protein n=1 Tax=Chilo suppressalis TaxID=168631 RepID=A0ABN8AZU8_CHISP|nr:unnamed protein product [Chilo suppressalis]
MSVQRSPPTGSDTLSVRSGSYPDLPSKTVCQDTPEVQKTFRNKRKLGSDYEEIMTEFSEMKKQITTVQNQMSEMMTYLSTMVNMQTDNFKKLNVDVSVIKQQMHDIKLNSDTLSVEQAKLKLDIDNLKINNNITEKKIESIESSLQHDNTSLNRFSMSDTREELVAELSERNLRSRNIIVMGVPEPKADNPKERREEDMNAILNILRNILGLKDIPDPDKIYRLGKYQSSRQRHMKVCFTSQETATLILKSKQNLNDNNIKIFSDQTPQQQDNMKMLKYELEQRTSSGEENLCIKYIRGILKIIKEVPKNPNQHFLHTKS